ncbi:MAG: dihydroorotate dehydrogenase [Candidatus Syntropharchaeia archaeon]
MSSISTEITGIHLDNPTMLAAGILGVTGSSLSRVARAGAGAVVTKSISVEERFGYRNPTVIEDFDHTVLNAMGLPNPGCEEFVREISLAKRGGKPIIASIFGSNTEEFVYVAKKMEKAGVDALELNVSCPHSVPGVKTFLIGQDPELTFDVTENVVKSVKIPVWVKLTPNVSSISKIAEKAADAGAGAVTAINTVPAARIDINTGYPILGNTVGGLSGRCIFSIALRAVVEIKKSVDISVIGVGGITGPDLAIEMMLAGASAVQIGTAVMYEDLQIFEKVKEGIRNYMEKHGYERVEDFVGLSLKYFRV